MTYLINFKNEEASEASSLLKKIENEYMQGSINPLELRLIYSFLENWADKIKSNPIIQEHIFNEALKYGTGKFEVLGVKMQISESGTKYDYSNCNDERLNIITKQIKDLTEQKKAIEKELQLRLKHKELVNYLTGEVLEVKPPPVKTSKTIVKVFL